MPTSQEYYSASVVNAHQNQNKELAGIMSPPGGSLSTSATSLLEDIIERAFDAVVFINSQQQIIYFSAGAERSIGYTAEEIMGQPLDLLIPPQFVEIHRKLVQEFEVGSDVSRPPLGKLRTILCKRKDGSEFPAEATITKIRSGGEDTKQTAMGVFLRDITERVRLEQSNQQSVQLFQAVLDAQSAHICVLDETGTIIGVNKAWRDFARENGGETSRVLEGVNYLTVAETAVGADSTEGISFARGIRDVLEGKVQSFSLEYPCHTSAEQRWFCGQVTPFADGFRGVVVVHENVTFRKKAEEDLRHNEARLKQAQHLARIGIWEWHIATDRTTWSEEMFRIYGISPEEFTGRGQDYIRFTHPEDIERQQTNIRQDFERASEKFLKNGYNVDTELDPKEFRIIRPDGTVCWVVGDSVEILNEAGQPDRMLGILRDITEWKEIERSLRNSREQYEALVNSLDSIVWEAKPDFQFIFISKQVERLLGYSPEEWLKEPNFWVSHIYPDDQEWAVNFCVTCTTEKKSYEFDYRMVAKDGRIVWLHDIITVVVENDQVVKLRGVMVDITDRELMTEALRQSEARYRAIVEEQPELICRFLLDTTLTFVNGAYCRYLSKSYNELIGVPFLPFVYAEDQTAVLTAIQSLSPGNPVITIEHRVVLPDGDIRWQRWTNHIILDHWGQVYEYQATGRDITENKKLEEALFRTQKLESMGVFAAGVAHDFNNILTAVLAQSSLALMKISMQDPVRHRLEMVIQVSEQAANITRQLLDYSGKGPQNVAPIDLNTTIQNNLPLLEVAVPHTILLQPTLTADSTKILADAGQIQQIVMNLVINAAEAYEGPGVIKLQTTTQELTAKDLFTMHLLNGDLSPGHYVCLTVIDHGKGMDEATQKRIFDPFFTTKTTGRGLGLAAVLGIVHSLKGSIALESEPGKGTTFRIYLPRIQQLVTAEPESSEALAKSRPSGTILLADDETHILKAVSEYLELSGFRVLTAVNGQEAHLLFEKYQSEVVLAILDMTMPVMTGQEAFQKIRDLQQDLPVILLSGYNDALVIPVYDKKSLFLQKPFRFEKLIAAVHQLLS